MQGTFQVSGEVLEYSVNGPGMIICHYEDERESGPLLDTIHENQVQEFYVSKCKRLSFKNFWKKI